MSRHYLRARTGEDRASLYDDITNKIIAELEADVLAVGEGIETMLSLRYLLPTMPMAAALSANHLSAMTLASSLRRLYIARDADAAGGAVVATLSQRAADAGIEAIKLSPRLGDFNEDLHIFGIGALRAALPIQLVPEDGVRFLHSSTVPAE
jgi:phage/plasmid primase-like uncharacterized protein